MDHSSMSGSMEHTMAMTEHGMTSTSDHMDHGSMMDDDSMSMVNVTSTDAMMGDQFCNGDGSVMLMGFQSASKASVNCVLFLFEGAGVNSETKYAFAVIGVFLMGFTNEMIRYGRDRMVKNSDNSFCSDFSRTVAFAVQMLLAYFLMLLVMLYEYVFLIAIILGLSAGHLLTLKLVADSRKRLVEAGGKAPSCGPASSGSPCCNTGTTA